MTLAVRLRRSAFDDILRAAVHSTYVPEVYASRAAWQEAVARSSVRLQWDPDHHPRGAKLERRAIQLGLRGDMLAALAREWNVGIEDISDFVARQREHVVAGHYDRLLTPAEQVYPVDDPSVAHKLGIANWP